MSTDNQDELLRQAGFASTETHYLLLIHGTFAAPRVGHVDWYQEQPGNAEAFVFRLNSKLENTGLGKAVLRPCNKTPTSFRWSGENSHLERIRGAKELAEHLKRIATDDPTA